MNRVMGLNQTAEGQNACALVIYPNGYHTMMGDVQLHETFHGLLKGHEKDFEMGEVPGTRDVYFMIPEVNPFHIEQVYYFKLPAIVVAINGKNHEPMTLRADQIRAALDFFKAAEIVIGMDGKLENMFCLIAE